VNRWLHFLTLPQLSLSGLNLKIFFLKPIDYFRQEQAIVRAACEIQQRINRILGRTPPTRPFTASDIDIYNQMQGDVARLPYLVDELEEVLGLHIVVTHDTIEISDRTAV
jgi:hypothetical protein